MMIGYKNRSPRPGEILKVHRNLADRDGSQVWSIIARRDGRELVVAHASELMLHDVSFRVGLAGRARAVATRQRNVHAFAVGRLGALDALDATARPVTYSPFRAPYFTDAAGEPVRQSPRVLCDRQGVLWVTDDQAV